MSGTGVTVQPGWDVYGNDGNKVGTVREVEGNYFRVRTSGLLGGKDLFIPTSAIEDLDEPRTRVNLNVSKGDTGNLGWDHKPPESNIQPGAVTSRSDWRDGDAGEPAMTSRGSDLRTPSGVGADAIRNPEQDIDEDRAQGG